MPDPSLGILFLIIALALSFGFVNGLNDAANALATVVGTRALSPRNAVILGAVFNLAGAATGTAVAKTIGKGILAPEVISNETVIAALASIIIWASLATFYGLPISLTHGFVAGIAASGFAISGVDAVNWGRLGEIATAVITAPALGILGGFAIMVFILWIFRKSIPSRARTLFSRLQIVSSAFVSYSHGKNDGQMPIGVIMMALVAGGYATWESIPLWVIVISASAISIGTAVGGWRVMKTLGMRVTTLTPVQGFVAQTAAASVIESASQLGIPVSTTHCMSTSVMGVGMVRRFSAVRWGVAGNIVTAWIITFPFCGGLGYIVASIFKMIGS